MSLTPFPKPSLTLYDSNGPTIGMASLDIIHMIVFVEKLAPIIKLTKGEITVVNSKNMTSTLAMASVTSQFFSTIDVHDTYLIGKWRSIVKGN